MKELYKFENLTQFLDNANYPVAVKSDIEVIHVDFTQKALEGKIEFRTDGIYYLHNGYWQQGYMYIKSADVQSFGFPKYHNMNCKTIRDQKNRGYFDNHYFWSNEKMVDIQQRNTLHIHTDCILQLCGNCKKEFQEKYYLTTEDFFNSLEIEENANVIQPTDLDIFGYTKNWSQISRKFREKENYVCSTCLIDLSSHKRFLEVHHIDLNKTNNRISNLKSLCIECHINVDQLHLDNFKKNKARQVQLEKYKSIKKELLENLNSKSWSNSKDL